MSEGNRKLVERYADWASKVSWRWKRYWRRFEDEIDCAAYEALVVSARDFDETRGKVPFEAFCYRRISKEVYRTIRRLRGHEEFCDRVIEAAVRMRGDVG